MRWILIAAFAALLSGCITIENCCNEPVACGVGTEGQPYDGSGQYSEHDGGGNWSEHDGNDDKDHPGYVCVPE